MTPQIDKVSCRLGVELASVQCLSPIALQSVFYDGKCPGVHSVLRMIPNPDRRLQGCA